MMQARKGSKPLMKGAYNQNSTKLSNADTHYGATGRFLPLIRINIVLLPSYFYIGYS